MTSIVFKVYGYILLILAFILQLPVISEFWVGGLETLLIGLLLYLPGLFFLAVGNRIEEWKKL